MFRKLDSKRYKKIQTGLLKWKLATCEMKTRLDRGKTFSGINRRDIFLDQSSKAKERRAKINTWELIKLKSKGSHQQNERQSTKWEKIFAHDATDEELISKTYKQLIQSSIKKTNSPIKKQAWELNRHFSKEDRWPTGTSKNVQHH